MRDLLVLAVPCLVLGILYCCWRAVTLFREWSPAVATVMKGGYSDLDCQEDFWSFGSTIGTRLGWNWRDGEDSRLIEDEIVFTDQAGHQHRALVERRVRRGWRPSGVYTVWYERADPTRVTAFGPSHWLLMVLVLGVALFQVVRLGMQLAPH